MEIPSKSQIVADLPFLYEFFFEDGQLALPVMLVRNDGVVYDNDCTFTYFLSDHAVKHLAVNCRSTSLFPALPPGRFAESAKF